MNKLAITATEINRLHKQALASALDKSCDVRAVFPKSDMMSLLPPAPPRTSLGVWNGDRWMPEPGYLYCFYSDNGNFWVAPAQGGGTHVSRLYSGDRMATDGFSWRYTIFAENDDPDCTNRYYIGTRHAPLSRAGIHAILESYGLRDLKTAKIKGVYFDDTLERPFGEPDPENWYWNTPLPDDELHHAFRVNGLLNERGVPIEFTTK